MVLFLVIREKDLIPILNESTANNVYKTFEMRIELHLLFSKKKRRQIKDLFCTVCA